MTDASATELAPAPARPLSSLRLPYAAAHSRQAGLVPRPGSGATPPAPYRGGDEGDAVPGAERGWPVAAPSRRRRSGWGGRDAQRRGAPWENPRAAGMAAAAAGG